MPAPLLLAVLLVPSLAGCVPGGARSDGIPSADAPFTLTALDVGQSTFRFRGIRMEVCRTVAQRAGLILLRPQD
jgi:hypothetical protein